MGNDVSCWVGASKLPHMIQLIQCRAALQKSATHPTLRSLWVTVWQSACRAITSISISRAACHLMDVLLKLGVVSFSAVSDTVQSMLLSIELSGPALLTEASSALLSTIMRERIQENPTHFNPTSERILSWFLTKWTPSELYFYVTE